MDAGRVSSPDPREDGISEFLSALARVGHLLVMRQIELDKQPKLSDVTSDLRVSKTPEGAFESLPPEIRASAYKDVVISGYVEASLAGAHGVVWSFDLIRQGSRWNVDRVVTLHANREIDDVVEHLPSLAALTSTELAARVPDLVGELLRQPVPPIPSPSS